MPTGMKLQFLRGLMPISNVLWAGTTLCGGYLYFRSRSSYNAKLAPEATFPLWNSLEDSQEQFKWKSLGCGKSDPNAFRAVEKTAEDICNFIEENKLKSVTLLDIGAGKLLFTYALVQNILEKFPNILLEVLVSDHGYEGPVQGTYSFENGEIQYSEPTFRQRAKGSDYSSNVRGFSRELSANKSPKQLQVVGDIFHYPYAWDDLLINSKPSEHAIVYTTFYLEDLDKLLLERHLQKRLPKERLFTRHHNSLWWEIRETAARIGPKVEADAYLSPIARDSAAYQGITR